MKRTLHPLDGDDFEKMINNAKYLLIHGIIKEFHVKNQTCDHKYWVAIDLIFSEEEE